MVTQLQNALEFGRHYQAEIFQLQSDQRLELAIDDETVLVVTLNEYKIMLMHRAFL